jgi:hypothetical protein
MCKNCFLDSFTTRIHKQDEDEQLCNRDVTNEQSAIKVLVLFSKVQSTVLWVLNIKNSDCYTDMPPFACEIPSLRGH